MGEIDSSPVEEVVWLLRGGAADVESSTVLSPGRFASFLANFKSSTGAAATPAKSSYSVGVCSCYFLSSFDISTMICVG